MKTFYSLERGVMAHTCDLVLRKWRQENQEFRDILETRWIQGIQGQPATWKPASENTRTKKWFAFISKSVCSFQLTLSGVFVFWKRFPDFVAVLLTHTQGCDNLRGQGTCEMSCADFKVGPCTLATVQHLNILGSTHNSAQLAVLVPRMLNSESATRDNHFIYRIHTEHHGHLQAMEPQPGNTGTPSSNDFPGKTTMLNTQDDRGKCIVFII